MIAALLTVFGTCLLVERLRPGWKLATSNASHE